MSRLASKLIATSQLLDRANHAGKKVLNLPVEDICPVGGQVRKHFNLEALHGLAASMRNQGQIEPIIVSPKNEHGRYVIQKGERRYRAAMLAGWGEIEAIVNDDAGLSEVMLSMQQLAENIQREDLLPQEVAFALHKMKESGLSNKDIAESIGKSQPWVSQHISIMNARGIVLRLIEAGKAADATTINELIKLHEENPDTCEKYCQSIIESDGAIAVRSDVRKLRQGAGESPPQPKSRPDKAKYKTVKVQIPDDVMTTLEGLVDKINNNPKSSYGRVSVGDLLRILTEHLSVKSAEAKDIEVSGINLTIV